MLDLLSDFWGSHNQTTQPENQDRIITSWNSWTAPQNKTEHNIAPKIDKW